MKLAPLSGEAPRSGAGLVPESTTPTGVNVLQICKADARFTRLQKNIGVAAKLLNMHHQGKRVNAVMVTLTYRGVDDWRNWHMTRYIDAVRVWFKRLTGGTKPLQYVWVGETQERGALHYHVIFWLPKGVTMPKADKRGWWPHGMTNTLKANKPVGYLTSYVKKLASKKGIPHGARIYGVGGLPPADRDVRRWINWPAFVQARASVEDKWRPAKGGGWLQCATGEIWPSEYGLSFATPRHTVVVRLHDHGRPLGSPGPFCWLHSFTNTSGVAALA